MNENKNYEIKNGTSIEDYKVLIYNLYKSYPDVAKAKIFEFDRAFSVSNPFFKYGSVQNYFLFDREKVVGHIAAIFDNRFGEVGSVGFFECEDKQEYADILFKNAIEFLKINDKKQCRGPINISVWQNSRVSYAENNPPFYLEPFTLEYYKDLFVRNNFLVSHQNITTTESIDKTQIQGYEGFYEQSIKDGYSYELLDKNNIEKTIKDIYFLTCKIFEGSYSFYNISEEEFFFFAKQYAGVQNSHCIFVIRNQKGEAIGFFLAMPDLYNLELKRIVMKTMGILPEYRGLGLAKAMLYFVYKSAKEDGFKELIFSTISIDNKKIKTLTGQNLAPYRKYEVYEKNI